MTELVEITPRDGVLEIVLNRPEKKNAVTSPMYAAMTDAIAKANSGTSIRAILFAGRGDAFCAGNDLKDFLSNPPTPDSPVIAFLNALAANTTVMIAAIQGACVGIGATLLLHCDHVVAANTAELQFNFVKIALVPEAASSLLLPRAVGRLKAAELMLLGDPLPAFEAQALGLVSEVVEDGDPLPRARAFAARLAALPPEAVRLTRQLLRNETEGVKARMDLENEVFRRQLRSPEFNEAVQAFLQKRKPNFG